MHVKSFHLFYHSRYQLEPFKKLDFAGKTLSPDIHEVVSTSCYQYYCMCRWKSDPKQKNRITFSPSIHEDYVAIFWKEEIKQVTHRQIHAHVWWWWNRMSLLRSFPGFSLYLWHNIGNWCKICCIAFWLLLDNFAINLTCSAGQCDEAKTISLSSQSIAIFKFLPPRLHCNIFLSAWSSLVMSS